jgi:IS5 family transposase
MKKTLKPNVPKEHPKPFQSQLWPHLETIRQMRRERKMWTEIADHLKTKGVTVSYRTVRNFFLRTRSPKRRIPAGFEEALGVIPKQPAPAAPAPARPAAGAKPEPPDSGEYAPDIYDRAVEALRQKEQQQQPKGVSHFPPGTII